MRMRFTLAAAAVSTYVYVVAKTFTESVRYRNKRVRRLTQAGRYDEARRTLDAVEADVERFRATHLHW